jgi:hypothetical protein
LRQRQFVSAGHDSTALSIARKLIAGKIRNQRTLLQRNHIEPPETALRQLKLLAAPSGCAWRDSTSSPEKLPLKSTLGMSQEFRKLFHGANQRRATTPNDGIN